MKREQFSDSSNSPPLLCQRCGALLRLVGSEPHPVQSGTDLLTYSCTDCDELVVLPVKTDGCG